MGLRGFLLLPWWSESDPSSSLRGEPAEVGEAGGDRTEMVGGEAGGDGTEIVGGEAAGEGTEIVGGEAGGSKFVSRSLTIDILRKQILIECKTKQLISCS